MTACEEAKQFVLLHMEGDIAAHERGDYAAIGQMLDSVPSWTNCDSLENKKSERILIAINFWDRWVDARNHDWGYYPGLNREDWPIIARQICAGLQEGWDMDRMINNSVFNPLVKQPKTSWASRLFSTKGDIKSQPTK